MHSYLRNGHRFTLSKRGEFPGIRRRHARGRSEYELFANDQNTRCTARPCSPAGTNDERSQIPKGEKKASHKPRDGYVRYLN